MVNKKWVYSTHGRGGVHKRPVVKTHLGWSVGVKDKKININGI
jgi:hypothetical protein